jgi:lysophospholipase L1-like esterase
MIDSVKPRRLLLKAVAGLVFFGGICATKDALAQTEGRNKEPLRILCVGDSITAAPWARRRLKSNLAKAGYATDFVGSQFGANPEGGFTDGEHEGYPGYKIADVAAKLIAPSSGTLTRFTPDIVLIMLGTNDIGQGQSSGAADRLSVLLHQIRLNKPKAHVFVGTIPPILENAFSGYNIHRADVTVYNKAIERLVAQMKKRDKRLHLVDVYSQLPATSDYIGDGVHPTGYGVSPSNDGYARIGDAWFGAITKAVPPPTDIPK